MSLSSECHKKEEKGRKRRKKWQSIFFFFSSLTWSLVWMLSALRCESRRRHEEEKKEKDEEMVPWKSNLERKEKERKKWSTMRKRNIFHHFPSSVQMYPMRLNGSMTTTASSELSFFWLAPLYSLFQFDFRIITAYWMRRVFIPFAENPFHLHFVLSWCFVSLELTFSFIYTALTTPTSHDHGCVRAIVPAHQQFHTNSETQYDVWLPRPLAPLYLTNLTFFPPLLFSFDPSRSPLEMKWNGINLEEKESGD